MLCHMNVTKLYRTVCPLPISEIAVPDICVFRGGNLIVFLIKSATQNRKQMEVAVGEENTWCVSDNVPMVTVKRLQQFGVCDHSLLIATGSNWVLTFITNL